jgi:hypothetical protein
MTIVKDDSRVINKLEASLTDDARVISYDRHMFIVQATGVVLCYSHIGTKRYPMKCHLVKCLGTHLNIIISVINTLLQKVDFLVNDLWLD